VSFDGLLNANLPTATDLDGVRHALGLGLVTTLIVGMGLLLLPAFANEQLGRRRQRSLAIALGFLLNSAAMLRVAPALFATGAQTHLIAAFETISGGLVEIALITFGLAILTAARGYEKSTTD
jgi:hypothetical protein